MNLNHLTVFVEVMTTGSLSQAARNLGRTQPAVSLALKALEDHLGLPLFLRRGRTLLPVPEAQFLLEEANDILARVAKVSTTMESLKSHKSGRLSLAAMPGPSTLLFPRFVSRHIGAAQDISVSLVTRSSPQIVQLVASQSIDFGFADRGAVDHVSGQYEAEVISSRCLCGVPRRHPLAARSIITPADLAGEPMGLLLPDHFSHQRTCAAFEAAEVPLNIRMQSQNFVPILPFVEAGQCCTVLDPLSVETYRQLNLRGGEIVFRPFAPDVVFDYAIYRPKHRPASRLAADLAKAWRTHVVSVLERWGAFVPSIADGTK